MVPQTKVFIGSLPQGSKPEDLRKLFERFGVVTECDIMNKCGFVHMQTEEQANAAIRSLHNTTFNGAVISVERGRIKDRSQRGGGMGGRGGGRGAMRGGMDRRGGPGPMRAGPPMREAPYMRDARPMSHMRSDMRGPMTGGMGMRNGMSGGYDRGVDRAPPATGYDDRYNGYGVDDRRGYGMIERPPRDPYAAPAPVYQEDRYWQDNRRGYNSAPVDDMAGMYPEDRRPPPMYPEERDMMGGRGAMRGAPIPSTYDRPAAPRAPIGNGEMYTRRSPIHGGAPAVGAYERDPYAQQYPPMGRGGGVAAHGRDFVGGIGSRRY